MSVVLFFFVRGMYDDMFDVFTDEQMTLFFCIRLDVTSLIMLSECNRRMWSVSKVWRRDCSFYRRLIPTGRNERRVKKWVVDRDGVSIVWYNGKKKTQLLPPTYELSEEEWKQIYTFTDACGVWWYAT